MINRSLINGLLLTAVAAQPLVAGAVTPEEHLAWLKDNQAAKPQFIDGDVIKVDKADLIRPFIPVEYQPEVIFDSMEMRIKDAGDLSPPEVYTKATAQFQSAVTLAADGAIENHTAGLPFDPATFQPGSKEDGSRLIWNFSYRWQNDGLRIEEIHWVWVRKGGSHDNHEVMGDAKYKEFYQGGGTFERVLTGPYQRTYFSHRADLADTGYRIDDAFAKGTEFREYTGFTSPFDISGTAFLILRYEDPRKADDSWAYIPSLRRVRRISVEVKSDSLLGTDHTLEDFYCFAGRPLEHEWEYVGVKDILAVARSRNADTVFYGPNGLIPLDDWAVRTTDVVKMTPKRDSHPYSQKFLYIDRQSGECYYANAFDKAGQLWKLWQLSKVWTEDPQYQQGGAKFKAQSTPLGTRMSAFQSINVIDIQNGRGTLVPCRGNSYPDTTLKDVKKVLDVNYLTEGR